MVYEIIPEVGLHPLYTLAQHTLTQPGLLFIAPGDSKFTQFDPHSPGWKVTTRHHDNLCVSTVCVSSTFISNSNVVFSRLSCVLMYCDNCSPTNPFPLWHSLTVITTLMITSLLEMIKLLNTLTNHHKVPSVLNHDFKSLSWKF